MSAYNPPSQNQSIFNPNNYGIAISTLADSAYDEITATLGNFTTLFIGTDNVATTLNGKQEIIVSTTDITCRDITTSGYIDRQNSFVRYYKSSVVTGTAETEHRVAFSGVSLENANLIVKENSNRDFRIVKAGRYRIVVNVGVDQNIDVGTDEEDSNMVTWRIRNYVQISGVDTHNNEMGGAFCSTRDNNAGAYNSLGCNTILNLAVGDIFYVILDCYRGTTVGFGDSMLNLFILNESSVEFEYLGES